MLFRALIALSVVMSGCGIYKSKISAPGPEVVALAAEEIGYAEIQKRIFQPSCIECHRYGFAESGVRLDTYADVRANLGGIYDAVVIERSMPPDGPLPDPRIQELSDWISRGAPLTAGTGAAGRTSVPAPAPTSAPAFVRGSLTYRDLQDKVITPQCVRCHNENRARGNVRLDTEEAVRAELGNIRESVFQKRSMPPKPMPPAMHEYLREWIDAGAPHARLAPKPESFLSRFAGAALSLAGLTPAQAEKPAASSAVPYRETDGAVDFYAIGKPSMLKVHGHSAELTGTLERQADTLSGKFTIPMAGLKTGGVKLRDRHLHEKVFETSKFPTSELTLDPLPAKSDEELPFKGKLRFHGVERDVAGTVRLRLEESRIGYDGNFRIKQSDFGIQPPEYMGMSMQDEVTVEVKGRAEK